MSFKPDIVLDIAGVIATNFTPRFWNDLVRKYEISYDELIMFRKHIRQELWTGEISEDEFCVRLKKEFVNIDLVYSKSLLRSLITPLPAIEEIPNWSRLANIHLLSNHRLEWIRHIIYPIQEYIESITISGEVGYCKPQRDIYLIVNNLVGEERRVLFIDDQIKNLKEASNLGWKTLIADERGEWIKKVPLYLQS
jgi:putative hydrolase of the HAD superfamily